jgi:ferredoxin-type protein NapF
MSRDEDNQDAPDLSRRAFLRGGFLTTRGRKKMDKATKPLGPTPPCLADGLATPAACVGCDAPCVAACPEDIIRLHGDDHAYEGWAYLDFFKKGCTFCGDCHDVCPASDGAPASANPNNEEKQTLGLAILTQSKCMAWDSIYCMGCKFACQDGAILMDEKNRPSIDADKCTGCGLCVAPCPTKAIVVLG